MATTGQKWLLGCGIGCGGALLLVAVGIFAFGLFVRHTVKDFDQVTETGQKLEEQVGPGSEYTPPPDGAVPKDRMEAFLAVREATQDERRAMAEVWQGLPLSLEQAREIEGKPIWEQLKQAWSITRSGFGIAGEIGRFTAARNEALLERDMSLGEYSYIYVLAYHSWLGKPVTDSPGEKADPSKGGEQDVGDMMGREMAREVYGGRVRGLLTDILRNQLGTWPDPPQSEEARRWRERLRAEIDALEAERLRVPWQDGLPDPIAASFEPYREDLLQSYLPATNPFELAKHEKEGGFSFQMR
jgi:hypothetical protein